MPSETDLYFTTEDNRREVELMKNAELVPIPTNGVIAVATLQVIL